MIEFKDSDFQSGGFGCTEGTPLIAIRMDSDFDKIKNQIVTSQKIEGRLDQMLKKFEDTDWKALLELQPVEFSYAERFHSMLKDLKGK